MSALKVVLGAGLTALCLSACGITAKPMAGSADLSHASGNHAKLDDPRIEHERCLRANHLPYTAYLASGNRPAIQVGSRPSGPTIIFEPTDGDAQGVQITDQAPGAEVIGSALLYPNSASDSELDVVEHCVALGVTG